MSRRTLGVVPAAWTSKLPPSIAPVFRRTSGGWITGPALVSATSRASAHGRTAGKSSASRGRTRALRDAGNTPTGRLVARTGAVTAGGAVLLAGYGSDPVSASASGNVPPARTIPPATA